MAKLFNRISTNNDHCFLCGNEINDNSEEHIFPKWLIKKFNLWNQRIHLLNRTTILYRSLVIPCCRQCNTNYLSKVENIISTGVDKGYEHFSQIDELLIFQWVTKIYYGLFFKELSLLLDQKDETKGAIVNSDFLQSKFHVLHGFMQSIIKPVKFTITNPWSIFIYKTLTFNDERDFDYCDGLELMTFAIRMGEISIIVCFEDNGTQKLAVSDIYERIREIPLHPVQFDELVAKVMYSEYLRNRTPKYITIQPENGNENEDEEAVVISLPLGGMSSKPIYNQWKQKEYATFLFNIWRKWNVTWEDVFREPNQVLSMLYNDDNKINILDISGAIIGTEQNIHTVMIESISK